MRRSRVPLLIAGGALFLVGAGVRGNVEEITLSIFGCQKAPVGNFCIGANAAQAGLMGGIGWLVIVAGVVVGALAFLPRD